MGLNRVSLPTDSVVFAVVTGGSPESVVFQVSGYGCDGAGVAFNEVQVVAHAFEILPPMRPESSG